MEWRLPRNSASRGNNLGEAYLFQARVTHGRWSANHVRQPARNAEYLSRACVNRDTPANIDVTALETNSKKRIRGEVCLDAEAARSRTCSIGRRWYEVRSTTLRRNREISPSGQDRTHVERQWQEGRRQAV